MLNVYDLTREMYEFTLRSIARAWERGDYNRLAIWYDTFEEIGDYVYR